MKKKTRERLFFWARIVIALAFICFIVLTFDLDNTWKELKQTDLMYVGLAALIYLAFLGFISLRWFMLSRARKHPYGFLYLYRSVIIHMLFNNVLPSTIGGDVYRIMDTGGHEGKGVAFSIVWTDRMVGFIGVFSFALLASTIYTLMTGSFLLLAIFGAMFVFAVSLTIAFLSERINNWLSPWLSRFKIFGYPLGEKIAGAFKSITHYRNHKKALFSAAFTSLGVQISLVAVWFLLFKSLPENLYTETAINQTVARSMVQVLPETPRIQTVSDSFPIANDSTGPKNKAKTEIAEAGSNHLSQKPPGFIHFMVTIPIVNTTAMFSVGGWGVREVTFVNVLSSFSIKASKDKFLATSILFDTVNVFFGLIGGLFLLMRRKKPRIKSDYS